MCYILHHKLQFCRVWNFYGNVLLIYFHIQADRPPGPIPPKFDRIDYQSPRIGELRQISIGMKTESGKLDLLVYCPTTGRCPYCKSSLIVANSVGKRKLCYSIPWPKTVVGLDMRCKKCKKHFMTHDPLYISTLSSHNQIKCDGGKGNCTHMSIIRLLRSGLTVAQVERYITAEVQEHYLKLKSQFVELWDKVYTYNTYNCICTSYYK